MVARVGSTKANLRFALLGAGLVTVVVPASLWRKKRLDKARAAQDACLLAAADFVHEKVGGVKTVLSFGRQALEAEAFGALADATSAAEEGVAAAEGAYMATLDFCVKASAVSSRVEVDGAEERIGSRATTMETHCASRQAKLQPPGLLTCHVLYGSWTLSGRSAWQVSVVGFGSSLVRRGHLTAGQLAAFTMYATIMMTMLRLGTQIRTCAAHAPHLPAPISCGSISCAWHRAGTAGWRAWGWRGCSARSPTTGRARPGACCSSQSAGTPPSARWRAQ